MGNYQTLVTIDVKHLYHTNGVCSCLDFYPTGDTQRVFDNAGLLFRNTDGGILLAYDVSRLDALRLYAEDEQDPLCFTFKVYSSDPDFRSYTEPFTEHGEGRILYLDNLMQKGVKKNNILTASEYVSSEDLIDINAFSSNRSYRVDADGQEEKNIHQLKGILSNNDLRIPPEFVLRIYARDNKGSLLKQWLEPEPTVYSIAFNSRKRYWQYYVLGSMAQKDCSVVDFDQHIEFEDIGEIALADERFARSFISKQSIPLSEQYAYRFQLKEKNSNVDSIVIDRLPVASMRQVGRGRDGHEAPLAAEIYINS